MIRISGEHSREMAQQFLPEVLLQNPRHVYFSKIVHPIDRTILDEGCVIFFEAPHSYTGEDVVEFHLHGNPFILKSVLAVLVELGVRLATSGEFTKRAFLHGKMDLTKAESVYDILHANTPMTQSIALGHLAGKLWTYLSGLRHEIMVLLEHMQGSIDFPDEIDPIPRLDFISRVKQLEHDLEHLIALQDYGKSVFSGVRCVILGKPNVGKSSLLNQLAGHPRAIVSRIAGTTRDFIEVKIELGGIQFEFVDTAGLRHSQDEIEKKGIRQVSSLVRRADAIFWVVDQSRPFDEDDDKIMRSIPAKKPLYMVLNKSDKKTRWVCPHLNRKKLTKVLSLCAKTGVGMDGLKQGLCEDFLEKIAKNSLDLMCNARQLGVLKKTRDVLSQVLKTAQLGFEDALLVMDLEGAIRSLGELTGADITEEMLDGIFSKFCVGK